MEGTVIFTIFLIVIAVWAYIIFAAFYRHSKFKPLDGEYVIYMGPASQQYSQFLGGNLIFHGLITITNYRIHFYGSKDLLVPSFIKSGNIRSRSYYYSTNTLQTAPHLKRLFSLTERMTSLTYISESKLLVINKANAGFGKEFYILDFPIGKEIKELAELLKPQHFNIKYY